MAITKNALIRYQTLNRCFRNPGRRYSINDLLEECNKSLAELNVYTEGIKKRQLYEDIKFMESSQGWSIPLARLKEGRSVFFKYEDQNFSINNQPINELEAEQLKSAMSVLQRFKGLPQFKWINELLPKIDQAFNFSEDTSGIISFDNNEFLKGLEFIDPLFNAILYNKTVKILYQSFKNPEPVSIIFSPYHLKEYNNRWFVYGKNSEYDNMVNLALDRFETVEEFDGIYETTDINFEEYFEDTIGVSIIQGQEPEKIKLRIDNSLWPYIETKPIHGSQKVLIRKEDYTDILLELIPNYELESQILHFGEKVEVLEPLSLRQKINNRIKSLFEKYNECR
ncbi:helix-turn-helix transcriptional regulator [Autumnicola musiva]|uniref:WYL domain-containing protein n=1 Tax=Autumnicola musiva TaxID=3075589 RepID=A0ABU3D653_9FLAO|nr:WYL domain-containing protein [Zunongwangia sp. F117]MDT0677009.1 WYL domain-containing protein [Zunongwangia sp. F117]